MGVFILLVVGVIGLVVLTSLTDGFCEGCVDQTSFTDTNVVSDPVPIWENHTCVGEKCDTDYLLTCNGTEMEAGVDYSISDCDYRLENAAYNATNCTLDYTAVTSDTYVEGILGTIICLLPVLVALGLLVGAVAWVAL